MVKLFNKHVYIVLEHADTDYDRDAVIHGVYSTREIANKKAHHLRYYKGFEVGYISVLKKSIQGPPSDLFKLLLG